MDSPAQIVIHGTEVLDRVIENYGDRLFMGVAFAGVAVIIWILTRQRRSDARHEGRMAIVILNTQARQQSGSEPDPIDDSQSR